MGAEKDTGISKGSTTGAGCCAELKLILLPLVNFIFKAFTRPLDHHNPVGWKAMGQRKHSNSAVKLQHYSTFLGLFRRQASTSLSSAKHHKPEPPKTPQVPAEPSGRPSHSTVTGVGRGLGPAAARCQRGSPAPPRLPRQRRGPAGSARSGLRRPRAAEPLPPRGAPARPRHPPAPGPPARPGLPPAPAAPTGLCGAADPPPPWQRGAGAHPGSGTGSVPAPPRRKRNWRAAEAGGARMCAGPARANRRPRAGPGQRRARVRALRVVPRAGEQELRGAAPAGTRSRPAGNAAAPRSPCPLSAGLRPLSGEAGEAASTGSCWHECGLHCRL